MAVDPLNALLDRERARAGDWMIRARVIFLGVFFLITILTAPGSSAFVLGTALVAALALRVLAPRHEALRARAWLAFLVIDLPTTFISNYFHLRAVAGTGASVGLPDEAVVAVIVTGACCVVLVQLVIYSLAIRPREFVLVAITCAIYVVGLATWAGLWRMTPFYLAYIVLMSAVLLYVQRRSRESMLELIDEQAVRARKDREAALVLGERVAELERKELELQSLNAELKRQVAERSRALVTSLGPAPAAARRLPEVDDVFDGRYRVVRTLGRGGMGVVLEVHRLSDGKPFALKLMTGTVDAELGTRFLREAELAARINHVNLVSVVDVGTNESGTLFLVMDLVSGQSLEQLSEKWTDRAWALAVLAQVARGVEALHREQVVHRDLKPANVLVSEQQGGPAVKVSDFGIARQLSAVDPLGDTADQGAKEFTHTGATIGTPKYLPPDIVGNARAATTTADAFSFGVMACEVLCGRYPFLLPPALEVMAGRPPSDADTAFLGTSGLPARLVEVLVRCLSLRATVRPGAAEILAALEEARASLPGPR